LPRKLGIVASASDVKELKHLINKIKKNPNEIKKPFIKNYRKILPKTKDGSTKKATDVILNVLKE